MTRRERLTRIFRGELPDRPAVKLWGVTPDQKLLDPAYEPVYRKAVELTDLVMGGASSFNLPWGSASSDITSQREVPTDSDEWVDVITEYRTPDGILQSVHRKSTVGKPGYQREYPIKEPGQLEWLLRFPYEPFPFSADPYLKSEQKVGDRGITFFGLDHPAYGLHRLIGSENLAFWIFECRDLLLEIIRTFSDRVRRQASLAFDAGLCPVFGWVGPELYTPPLMSPANFDVLVAPFDRRLIDEIHGRGGYVWVHCHGMMDPVIDRFVDMGVDVLNPLEPPPMGDLTLAEAFDRVGDRMALEGNIQIHDLLTCSTDQVRDLVQDALTVGAGKRHILCTCSGYMEWVQPEQRYIDNLMVYVEDSVRFAEGLR